MRQSKLLLALLSSLAVGAVAGILFAPKKGRDTRKNISKQSKEYANSLKHKFNEYIDGISEKLDTLGSDGFEKKVHSRINDL